MGHSIFHTLADTLTGRSRLGRELCEASSGDNRSAIDRLLAIGAPLDWADPSTYGRTPLVQAVDWGTAPTVAYLLEVGASSDFFRRPPVDTNQRTALVSALWKLQSCWFVPEARAYGEERLADLEKKVRHLLGAGANPNFEVPMYLCKPMFYAEEALLHAQYPTSSMPLYARGPMEIVVRQPSPVQPLQIEACERVIELLRRSGATPDPRWAAHRDAILSHLRGDPR